jgi:hypothetical protein
MGSNRIHPKIEQGPKPSRRRSRREFNQRSKLFDSPVGGEGCPIMEKVVPRGGVGVVGEGSFARAGKHRRALIKKLTH